MGGDILDQFALVGPPEERAQRLGDLRRELPEISASARMRLRRGQARGT